MAIIISENGKNAKRVEESKFGLEDKLQQYIYDNPDAIPLYDIDQDTRLFIAAREFGTKSGPIDALGFDASGNIYVVETKLYKNADKRTVVAQALDYGASLWRHAVDFDDFLARLDAHCQSQFGKNFKEQYSEFFEIDDATENLASIKANLADGSIKFVVLMDKLHDALKDLVIFVNQNSKFDLYAVELEYYKHKDFEIIIPKLYGAEVKKSVTSTSSQSKTKWVASGESEFNDALSQSHTGGVLSDVAYEVVNQLVELYTSMTTKTGGNFTYFHVTTSSKDTVRYFANDEKNRVTLVVESDGTIGAYKYGKTGPQIDYINSILDQLIGNNLFKKVVEHKKNSQWFVELGHGKSSDEDAESFLQICKTALKSLKA